MNKTYQWEIRTMHEDPPIHVHTEEDDVLAAITKFVEQNGNISVYSVRKSAEIIQYEEAILVGEYAEMMLEGVFC